MLYVNWNRLAKALIPFGDATGLKVSLYDRTGREIMAYPRKHALFCEGIRKYALEKCLACDKAAMKACLDTKEGYYVYQCHAGPSEVLVPLKKDDMIIGFMMFGQMFIKKEGVTLQEQRKQAAKCYCEITGRGYAYALKTLDELVVKSEREILGAKEILNICIEFLLFHQAVRVSEKDFTETLDSYIEKHIEEPISVEQLCATFGMGRTTLYNTVRRQLKRSIMSYIQDYRIRYACRLLCESDLPVTQISDKVGFNDYNYFLRIFKKKMGISCNAYRKENEKDSRDSPLAGGQ